MFKWPTWFELDSNPRVILDLLDHFTISSNHNSNSKPWHWNLRQNQSTT